MAEPIFSATLERLYRRLPEFLLLADAGDITAKGGWPLKRYLALVVDQAGALETLADRIDYITVPDGGAAGDTSELVDPAKADTAWLGWLAQLVGVQKGDLSPSALRAAVANARRGWQVGSQASVIAAAQAYLTGTKTVTVLRNWQSSPWKVRVTAYTAETPRLTLDQLAQLSGSLDAINIAYGSLNAIPDASVGIAAALELQRPAGVAFTFQVAAGCSLDDLNAQYSSLTDLQGHLATLEDVRTHIPGS